MIFVANQLLLMSYKLVMNKVILISVIRMVLNQANY